MTDPSQLPEGVSEALHSVAELDACLAAGLSRLAGDQRDALESFAATFAGSPLQDVLSDAVNRLESGEYAAGALLAIAAGRAALLGAAHDALLEQLSATFGFEVPTYDASPPPPSPHAALLSSTQQWLLELAVTGFENLEEAQLTPFSATLDQIQAHPDLTGLGALLSGMIAEWRSTLGRREALEPLRLRWADLWMAAYLAAQQGPSAQTSEKVSGAFAPVGVDIRQHGHFAAVSFYGVLDGRAVRVPFASYKVGVVTGDEVWKLFRPAADPYLQALQDRKYVELADAELSAAGDLIGGTTTIGGPVDLFDLEITRGFAAIEPTRRHPIQIAQLVKLPGCKVDVSDKAATHIDGLPIAQDRNYGAEELAETVVAQAQDVVGLIRFDGGAWRIQPLAVRGKGKLKAGVLVGEGVLKRCAKLKSNALDILSERAEKLLRAS